MINIRKAVISDADSLFVLFQQLPSRQAPDAKSFDTPDARRLLREVISDERNGTVFVADDGGNLLGVVTLSYTYAIRCGGRYSSIEEFVVGSHARGKGVGSKLLKAAIDEAKKQGCCEIHVASPSELGYPVYIRQNIKDVGRHLALILRE
ncbi:MAG: GNAT family N-acetyltransferase [Dehalococcoidales bacterium]|nr:GNAT family N-acetyltransferase [Dehalococcoidales bacterium]